MLVWQNFTNTQKPKYYPWQYFIKSPNASLAKQYHWQYFIKSINTSLATILQILKSPSTTLGNILEKFYKAQVLPLAIFWKNPTKPKCQFDKIFTNTQKPKYYPWQYFGKIVQSPNTITGNILQKSNAILAISYQQPKTITFFFF